MSYLCLLIIQIELKDNEKWHSIFPNGPPPLDSLSFPLLGFLFLELGRRLLGLGDSAAAGFLDRIRHFDLALGIAAEDDVFELGSVLGGDDGLDADLQIFIGDAVPDRAEVIPHGRFRFDLHGGVDGGQFIGEVDDELLHSSDLLCCSGYIVI